MTCRVRVRHPCAVADAIERRLFPFGIAGFGFIDDRRLAASLAELRRDDDGPRSFEMDLTEGGGVVMRPAATPLSWSGDEDLVMSGGLAPLARFLGFSDREPGDVLTHLLLIPIGPWRGGTITRLAMRLQPFRIEISRPMNEMPDWLGATEPVPSFPDLGVLVQARLQRSLSRALRGPIVASADAIARLLEWLRAVNPMLHPLDVVQLARRMAPGHHLFIDARANDEPDGPVEASPSFAVVSKIDLDDDDRQVVDRYIEVSVEATAPFVSLIRRQALIYRPIEVDDGMIGCAVFATDPEHGRRAAHYNHDIVFGWTRGHLVAGNSRELASRVAAAIPALSVTAPVDGDRLITNGARLADHLQRNREIVLDRYTLRNVVSTREAAAARFDRAVEAVRVDWNLLVTTRTEGRRFIVVAENVR